MKYELSENESKIIYIIKLFSIVFVLYIHAFSSINYCWIDNMVANTIQMVEYGFTQILARAGVPLFFLISSLLLYRKDFTFRKNLKKKNKRILIPYIICNTIWILLFAIFQNIEPLKNFFSNEENTIKNWNILNWIDAYIPIFIRNKPFVYPLWFLKDLYILNLFSKGIQKLIDKIPKMFLIIAFGMWIFDVNLKIIESQSLLFFSLGYYIVKYNIRFEKINNVNIAKVSLIYFLLSFLFAYLEITIKSFYILHNILILVSMIYVYIIASKTVKISDNTLGKELIKKSYFIYLYHEWNLLFIRKILDKLLGSNYLIDFVKYSFLPIIIIIICLILSKILKIINKKVYDIIVGEW